MAVRAFEDWLGCRAEQKGRKTASAFFEMIHMYRQYDDEPKVGGGLIAVFLLLLLSCLGAFAAAGGGVFEPAPPRSDDGRARETGARSWARFAAAKYGHPGNALACDRVDQSGDDLQL
jgi:hypothetical protein